MAGGGFVGAELAAAAVRRGCAVTVVEAQAELLAAQLGPLAGAAVAASLTEQGVDVVVGTTVEGFEGDPRGRLAAVRTTTGRTTTGRALPAAVAVVGLGTVPCTDWLRSSGVPVTPHVFTDEHCVVPSPAAHVPTFWSDIGPVRVRSVGLPGLADRVDLADGSLAERRFLTVHTRNGRIVAAVSVDRPRRLAALHRLIAEGATWSRSTPASPGTARSATTPRAVSGTCLDGSAGASAHDRAGPPPELHPSQPRRRSR